MREADFSRVTLLFAMPRARTQWLCWLFQNAGIDAWHDPMSLCASPAELVRNIRAALWTSTGPLLIVDTAGIFFHDALCKMMPAAKRAYLFRHPGDVDASFQRQGSGSVLKVVQEQSDRLYRKAFDPGCFRMYYGLIDERIEEFWQFVDGRPMPEPLRWGYDKLKATVIDVPLRLQPYSPAKAAQLARHKE